MPPLKVRKPSMILFDIMSSATKSYFIEQVLFPYIRLNSKTYLENNWNNSVLQHDVMLLRKEAANDKAYGRHIPGDDKDPDTIQREICHYINYAIDKLVDNEALTQFKFHILFDGYAKDRLETPVYTDVAIAIRHWAIDDGIKLFVLSNGWKEATKRYLQKTNHGDMNLLITKHFDTSIGSLTHPDTYKKISGKLLAPVEDVLFLTHNAKEGVAAKAAGMSVVLIATHRRDIGKMTEEEKKLLPFVRSFNELIFTGDAPKACELDGSSTMEDEPPSSPIVGCDSSSLPPKSSSADGSKYKLSEKKIPIVGSACPIKSKTKLSKSKSKSDNNVPSKSKSADGSKVKSSTDGGSKSSVLSSKVKSGEGSKISSKKSASKAESGTGGLSEAFSGSASKRQSKKSSTSSGVTSNKLKSKNSSKMKSQSTTVNNKSSTGVKSKSGTGSKQSSEVGSKAESGVAAGGVSSWKESVGPKVGSGSVTSTGGATSSTGSANGSANGSSNSKNGTESKEGKGLAIGPKSESTVGGPKKSQ